MRLPGPTCVEDGGASCEVARCSGERGREYRRSRRRFVLAFAGSKLANRLKPLLAAGLRWKAILVVLLQNLTLFGRLDDLWLRFNL